MVMHNNPKEKSSDRILVLAPTDGKFAKGAAGLSSTLFTGENNLHAIQEEQTLLWKLQYDHGGLPPVLKQKWTTFTKLHDFVKDYMLKRNVQIKEIKD